MVRFPNRVPSLALAVAKKPQSKKPVEERMNTRSALGQSHSLYAHPWIKIRGLGETTSMLLAIYISSSLK
jgi:hypothetical protein